MKSTELEKLVAKHDGRGVARFVGRNAALGDAALEAMWGRAALAYVSSSARQRKFWIDVAPVVIEGAARKRRPKLDCEDDILASELVAIFLSAIIEGKSALSSRLRKVLVRLPGIDARVAISVTAHFLPRYKRPRESLLLFDLAIERGDADGDTLDRAFEALAAAPPKARPAASRIAAWVKAAGTLPRKRPRLAAAMKTCGLLAPAAPVPKADAKCVAFGAGALRGVGLVEACIDRLSKGPRRRRAKPGARRGLPSTLTRFLSYDASFDTMHLDGQPFHARDGLGRRLRGSAIGAKGLKHPLLRFPQIGEQAHYLYAGKPDADGELPILGVEAEGDEIEVWIKYPSFDLYLADQLGIIDDPTEHRTFRALCRRHEEANPELAGR